MDGDVVWGAGINGKIAKEGHVFSYLDVRAVRGPLTGQWLERNKSIQDAGIYGDPALLLLKAVPQLSALKQDKRRRLAVIPNLNDFDSYASEPNSINPRGPIFDILRQLAQSEIIATSSLHGLVVGEVLGIPTALFRPAKENLFKYRDYVFGTGRSEFVCYPDLSDAIQALGKRGSEFRSPLASWDPSPLERSFPVDLWAV
ncbi:polysaccharide pyruvyl transferase family protein [Arthrobacter sp. SO5]|uniref:polysaccharide pyruvyl transferase family protein n=1 Tax=Arthrobacter sp. SO5 TaxID=1897055 RepID=UPI001E41D90F|nr:polysaccharide pyruvyl transferase family protein [Arthrobacter sp. SO5]